MGNAVCRDARCDITMCNDVDRDTNCDITMGDYVTGDIYCDVTMRNDIAMWILLYHDVTTIHTDVAMNLFYYVLLCLSMLFYYALRKDFCNITVVLVVV